MVDNAVRLMKAGRDTGISLPDWAHEGLRHPDRRNMKMELPTHLAARERVHGGSESNLAEVGSPGSPSQ